METKKQDKLYIVIPAYNEEENIEKCVNSWYPIVKACENKDSRLVIIDDGSTDKTLEKLRRFVQNKPRLIVRTKPNGGHGSTVLYGYRYAIEKGADYVFQTDSDGQTNPKEFKHFWDSRNEYDVILGNRTKRGDGAARAFTEKVVCALVRLFFGVKVPDANAPFRLMKADVLAKYIDRLPENYNLPNIMLTTYFKYYGEKLAFREISFKPRTKGKNTINLKRIVKIGWQSLKDFREFRKAMRNDESAERSA